MRVARGESVFGMTVFGNCLNPFFGTHASGLQKLVTYIDGPLEALSKSTLLVKAVEDCFIGKNFIFGIKVTNESEPWLGQTTEMAQLIATQMILPKATGLLGCTVLNYYEAIFQKATEYKLHTTDAHKTCISKVKPLLSTQCNSPTTRFWNDTSYSCSVSSPLLRSQHQDSSLSPTPPWQQTLGLITSSAEQEGSRNDYNKSQKHIEKYDITTDLPNLWLGLSPSAHATFSSPDITQSMLMNSIALKDFPLSENLAEFLNEKNRPVNNSQENNFSVGSFCQNNIQTTSSQSNCLLDVNHGASVHKVGERLTELDDSSNTECVDSYKNKKDEPSNLSEEEEYEGTVYNCSADLFSSSPRMDAVSFDTPHFQDIKIPLSACHKIIDSLDAQSTTEACSLPSKQKQISEKAQKPLTPDHQKLEWGEPSQRESFPPSTKNCLQLLDFIPPSQSTPVQKECVQLNYLTKPVRAFVKDKHNCCVTPKSRYGQVLNTRPKNYRRRPSVFRDKDNELIPPTPANHLTSVSKKSKCTVTLKTQHSNKSECSSVEAVKGLSECNDADEECDWSRDLFSDSV